MAGKCEMLKCDEGSNDSYKIISVESLKGGVGKSTIALNLAKILKFQNNQVLVLDLDLTGTSIEGFEKSLFWKDLLYIQEINKEESKAGTIHLNLIDLFKAYLRNDKDFNLGNLKFDENKINVIPSFLKNEESVVDRIFFDKMHIYWFLEMLEEICKKFCSASKNSKKCYVILDNAPGHSSLLNAIHDWLTTLGPKRGKFLRILSLDRQDIDGTCQKMESTENELISKLCAIESFRKLKDGASDTDIDEMIKKILENLKIFDNRYIDKTKSFLHEFFYREESDPSKYKFFTELSESNCALKMPYKDYVRKFQTLIINKVPSDYNEGSSTIIFAKEKFSNKQVKELISSNFLQFNEVISKQNIASYEKNEIFEYLKAAEPIRENLLQTFSKMKVILQSSFMPERNVENLYSNFENCLQSVNKSLSIVYPGSSQMLLNDVRFNYFYYQKKLIDDMQKIPMELVSVNQVSQSIKHFPDEEGYAHIHNFKSLWDSTLSYLKSNNPYYQNLFEKVLHILASILNNRLKKKFHFIDDYTSFLMNENLNKNNIHDYLSASANEMLFVFIRQLSAFPTMYNSFCHALANIEDGLDFVNKMKCVLDLIFKDTKEDDIPSFFIKDLLERSIIRKTLNLDKTRDEVSRIQKHEFDMQEIESCIKDKILSDLGLTEE